MYPNWNRVVLKLKEKGLPPYETPVLMYSFGEGYFIGTVTCQLDTWNRRTIWCSNGGGTPKPIRGQFWWCELPEHAKWKRIGTAALKRASATGEKVLFYGIHCGYVVSGIIARPQENASAELCFHPSRLKTVKLIGNAKIWLPLPARPSLTDIS